MSAVESANALMTRKTPLPSPRPLPTRSLSAEEADLSSARQALDRARRLEPVRPEATLRVGRVLARLREDNRALLMLSEVPHLTTDPELVHLSYLFRGEIYERTGRVDEAIDAYRAALTAAPRARTASLMLAPLLMKKDAVQEAASLADAAVSSAIGDDPWLRYTQGGMRHWGDRMARVREALDAKEHVLRRP
jgi:tetratricopeptide (TPR) repeat protein